MQTAPPEQGQVVQCHQNKGGLHNTASEEEWVTKKKVEVTTTKNVERRIKRQLVLEDGRVVEDELPQVTVDTTEDKQTFETDHDEERKVEKDGACNGIQSKFAQEGGLLVGDKFTSVKKIHDIRENCVQTEAVQNMGDIANRDVERVLKKNENIRKFLRKPKSNQQMAVAPRTVYTKKNHRTVTDKENVSERNWLHNEKMQNERIRTEEHVEYNSDDTPDDGDNSSTSGSSYRKLEPETYKTRKDENFTEYFKMGKRIGGKMERQKIADGPHYVSESKEVEREKDNQVDHKYYPKSRRIRKGGRKYLNENHERPASIHGKPTITQTDSWLERHFGSSSSSLSNSSMDISSQGLHSGGGLRRSASVCDVRTVEGSPNAFYATVKKTGKVSISKREKQEDHELYIQNRQSSYYSSSGQPIRPPRRKKRPEYRESSHSGSPQIVGRIEGESINGTLQKHIEPQMEIHYCRSPSKTQATEKYYRTQQTKYGSEKENHYGAPHVKENHDGISHEKENHYGAPHVKENHDGISHEKENHYGAPHVKENHDGISHEKENHYGTPHVKENHYGISHEKENHYGVQHEKENHYGVQYEKEKFNNYDVPIKQYHKVEKRVENHYVGNPKRSHIRENHNASQQRSRITHTDAQTPPQSNVTEKYYFGNPTTTSKTARSSHSSNHIKSSTSGYNSHNQEPHRETTTSTKFYREEPQTTSRSRLQGSSKDMYRSTGNIYATPHRMDHRITYTADSPNMSPSTKYKTKILLNASS